MKAFRIRLGEPSPRGDAICIGITFTVIIHCTVAIRVVIMWPTFWLKHERRH